MSNMVFKDRESQNPNRRKLKIVSQGPNEIIADIERADTVTGSEGTPINAKLLNDWNAVISTSENNASNALTKANKAIEDSSAAVSTANSAISVSNSAKQTATTAQNYVNSLIQTPDCSQAGNVGTPSVTFADAGNGYKKFVFRNLKGNKGDPGDDAGFGQITATATALPIGGTPYANISTGGPNTAKDMSFDFGLPAGIQGERGEKGDSTFVRYSFDKTTMTTSPVDSTIYIGFYHGPTVSENPEDYQWSRMWGAKSISEYEYKRLLDTDTLNPEQIYFVKGVQDNTLSISSLAQNTEYDNSISGLEANNVQEAIDALKANAFSKSYNDLTEKPVIPDNMSFTLSGLGEKSYNSLTDKPILPSNSSFTLSGLGEKSYNSLTDKPIIPDNMSFTLSGLGEKSYNSLTDKPIIPTVDTVSIASALGLSVVQLTQLVELAKVVTVTNGEVSFNTNCINVE